MTTGFIENITLCYMLIYGVLVLVQSIILFRKLFKYLIDYVFGKVNFEWRPQIEKPRILFAVFGYLFVKLAWEIGKLSHWIFTVLALIISLLGLFTLYFIFTKVFENKFLRYIKEKLNLLDSKAIINIQTHKIDCIFKEMNTKYFNTDIDSFYNMLVLNKISEAKRIEWEGTVADLVRFTFILFDIQSTPSKDLNHVNIRPIIEHYFQKEGEPIKLTDSGSEISNVKKEMDERIEIFSKYKNNLAVIFDQNKTS